LAQMSASWCNTQPWKVHVADVAATERFRKELYAYAVENPELTPDFEFPVGFSDVLRARRLETAWQLYNSVGIAWGDREGSYRQALENFRLFGAPHVMLVTSDADLGPYGGIDTGIFIGNLLLALQALGIGAVAQAALASHAKFVRKYFGIGDHRRLVLAISFGWPDETHPSNQFRTLRAPPEDVIHWLGVGDAGAAFIP
ncbi:MAG: nitroreductase family protein, partial [Hyphomonadaceae bacterium]